MKKIIIMAIAILLAGTAGFAQVKQGTAHKHQHKSIMAKRYTCTMHPEVVKSKPGKCPKCGMKLIAMKAKKTS